jgi:all-trans-8'-apo-beta-carotenal 15,15'-oxygenase
MPQPHNHDRFGSALNATDQRNQTDHNHSPASWYGAIAKPSQEFELQPLSIVAGKIPGGLRGSFYRNGAGRLGRGGIPAGHWFDGDGAILAVHFDGDRAQGVYRYVQTQGYLAEQQAGKLTTG